VKTHLPAPTVWPAVLASGVTFAAAGLVTSPLLIAFGAVLSAASIVGWTAELLRHER
jgi:hypothetical protein